MQFCLKSAEIAISFIHCKKNDAVFLGSGKTAAHRIFRMEISLYNLLYNQ